MLPLPEPRAGDARILLSAQVATDGGPIWVHTTHLHYRLDDGLAREHQVLAVDAAIRAFGRDNTMPAADPVRRLQRHARQRRDPVPARADHARRPAHALPGRVAPPAPRARPGDGPAQGITWSSENRLTRPLRSLDIDRRIDYVFVTSRKKDGRGTVHACRVVLTERDGRRGGICASDHYGVMADVQVVPAAESSSTEGAAISAGPLRAAAITVGSSGLVCGANRVIFGAVGGDHELLEVPPDVAGVARWRPRAA